MRTNQIPVSNYLGMPINPGIAPVAFFLLFPGFFFYHTMLGVGVLSAFIGGYFSLMSMLLFAPLAYAYYVGLKNARYRIISTDLQFGFFLVYFFFVVVVNAGFGADTVTVQSHLLSILYFVNIYLIFNYIDFSERKTIFMALVSLGLMSVLILVFSHGGSFQPGQSGGAKSLESVSTYQGFARSYALTFVAVICFTELAAARLVLYATAIVALFLNGARSELVAVLLLVPIIEVYRAKNGLQAVCIVLLMLAVVTVGPQTAMEYFPDSRVWELFYLSRSESAIGRYELTQRALQTIADHPFLGAYASYTAGGYSHNILSAWVDLGAFGFIYMLFMLAQAIVWLFVKGWLAKTESSYFLLAWSLICMSLVLLVSAKTFNDMFLGAAMGAYANYRFRNRQP